MPKSFYLINRQTFDLCTTTFPKIKHSETISNHQMETKYLNEKNLTKSELLKYKQNIFFHCTLTS